MFGRAITVRPQRNMALQWRLHDFARALAVFAAGIKEGRAAGYDAALYCDPCGYDDDDLVRQELSRAFKRWRDG